jgi:hypothetical protein
VLLSDTCNLELTTTQSTPFFVLTGTAEARLKREKNQIALLAKGFN